VEKMDILGTIRTITGAIGGAGGTQSTADAGGDIK
jgi:hypothetical protein